jgi:hypothetical protein
MMNLRYRPSRWPPACQTPPILSCLRGDTFSPPQADGWLLMPTASVEMVSARVESTDAAPIGVCGTPPTGYVFRKTEARVLLNCDAAVTNGSFSVRKLSGSLRHARVVSL